MLEHAGDWPRTTRLLPWLIALIMAIVFLVPFNDIVLDVPLPIDLYFDRLFLPVLMGVWAIALAVGGPLAPRIRLTWIHAAIGVFVAVGGLSVVLAARDIQHGLSWDLAIKKLALLGSYVSLFVIVASSVRRTEVRPFMTYTLILGCICAFGLIIEYRFAYNIFYRVSDMVLPGIFQVGDVDSLGVDEIGRREVRGPGQAPLETVAMIAMVLPIVIARLIHPSGERWERAKYGIAAAILLAGHGRDVPQERVHGADLGLPHDRLLPPPRAAQARAARRRAHPVRAGALTGRAERACSASSTRAGSASTR